MKTINIFMVMVLLSLPAFSGFHSKLPMKWGKVSKNEFEIIPTGADANAGAVILCDYGDIKITNRTFYTRHTRIKILNEKGLQYASVEIPYQTRNRHDVFYELKAQTMILENGKIVKYKVEPGQIEDVKINDRWSKKKFIFPKAMAGAIIEYEYQIASLDFEKLNTWYFQHEIPTLWSEIRFETPVPFVYLVTFNNNRELDQEEQVSFRDKLQWLYSTGERKRRIELAGQNYLLYNTGENRFKVWAMNNTQKKIVMKNLPGLSEGFNGQPVKELYPQVKFDLFESSGIVPRMYRPLILTTRSDYETRSEWSLMHDPSVFVGFVNYRMKTWNQFAKDLMDEERFGSYLIKASGPVSSISVDMNSDEITRINAIYKYVTQEYKWNGQYSMYTGQSFKDFLKDKSGSSAELNLLMVSLFRQFGIKSDPVLIRTSDNGLPERMYPVKNQFNHVIASAEINGKRFLFDATSNSSALNKLNQLDLETYGFVVNSENPQWIETFKAESDSNPVSPAIHL